MNLRQQIAEELQHQPEPVVREVFHYLRFLVRQQADEAWADVLAAPEVQQEVLDIIDGAPASR